MLGCSQCSHVHCVNVADINMKNRKEKRAIFDASVVNRQHKIDTSIIDLTALCQIHKEETDTLLRLALEELFAVCTNETFIDSIKRVRGLIEKETKQKLPIAPKRDIFYEIRKKLYHSNKWNWYQKTLADIRRGHKLIGSNYDVDPLSKDSLDFSLSSTVEVLNDLYEEKHKKVGTPIPTDKEIEEEANNVDISTGLEGWEFSCLESIIFFNDPLTNRFNTGLPHSNRGGQLVLDTDLLTGEWYVHGKFYINSSKKDMLEVIEREYGRIEEKRKKLLDIKPKKKVPKEDLYKIFRIFHLDKLGESREGIANKLDGECVTKEATLDSRTDST